MTRTLGILLAMVAAISAPAWAVTIELAPTQLRAPVNQPDQDLSKIHLELPGGAGDAPATHPVVPCLMSLAIPGLGQFYNGQPGKGVGFLVGSVGLTAAGLFTIAIQGLLSLGAPRSQTEVMAWEASGVAAILAGTGLHIWSMTDAWQVAAERTR